MGILDKIGDVLGDIVEGVVDFVDDVFNIDLQKVLNNKFVKYGLMAASIFTGGVAIANGIMTGFNAGSAATGFMNTFVEGAKGFISGVAKGFTSPVETFSDLTGIGGDALAQTGQALGSGPSDAANIADSIAPSDVIDGSLMGEGGVVSTPTQGGVGGGFVDDLGGTYSPTSLDPSAAGIQSEYGQMGADVIGNLSPEQYADRVGGYASDSAAMADSGLGATTPDFSAPAASGGDALESLTKLASEEAKKDPGFWSSFASGAKDWASSPGGIQTLVGMANGWAEGQAMEEYWDEKNRRRNMVAASYDTANAPRINGRLPTLRQMSGAVRDRGNQANAKYGY